MKKIAFLIMLSIAVFCTAMWVGRFGDPARGAAAVFLYGICGYFFVRQDKALLKGIILYAPNITFVYHIISSKFHGAPVRLYENLPLIFAVPIAISIGFLLKELSKRRKVLTSILIIVAVISPIFVYIGIVNYFNILNRYRSDEIFLKDIMFFHESGEMVDQTEWEGKVVLLDVWTRTCGNCIKQMPNLNEVYLHYAADPNVLIYSLYLPIKNDDNELMNTWFKKLQYDFPFISSKIDFKTVSKKLGFAGVPVVLLINKTGKVVYMGSLNNRRIEFVNNIYTLININK